MNILNIYYGENIGGIERNIEELSKVFKENNNFFLSFSDKNHILNIKGTTLSLNENINSNFLIKLFRPFVRSYRIRKICSQNNISISISHGDTVNISNILSKLLFLNKSKIIITINNSFEIYKNNIIGKFILKLIKFFYKFANKIIVISEEMKKEISKTIKNKNIQTIYNPIDIEYINKKKNENIGDLEHIFKNGKKTFIHIARLETIKNQEFILKSFNKYYNIDKNSQLIVLGDGSKKQRLIDFSKRLKTGKNIYFLGYQKNIYKFLDKSDYFLFASINEGFGRSLIESIACGIPILTHDFKYGAKEIVRNNKNLSICNNIEIHNNGILVPYMNEEKFVEGMELISNTKWYPKNITDNGLIFDIKNIRKSWKKILD